MNKAKKKMKLLATKLAALQAELSVSKEILQTATIEVERYYTDKYRPKVKNEKEDTPEKKSRVSESKKEEIVQSEKKSSEAARKVFKKIASQCHPDKTDDIADYEEKVKKQNLYQKARAALDQDDIITLSSIAEELEIEQPELTSEQIRKAESKLLSIKKELEVIESTAVWFWYFTEEPAKKQKILEELLDEIYKRRNPGA